MDKLQQKPAQELFWALSSCLVFVFCFFGVFFHSEISFVAWVEMQEKMTSQRTQDQVRKQKLEKNRPSR